MKSYILLNILDGIPNYQIQIKFIKKINFNIGRQEINNIKYLNKVCNMRRHSSDLISITNFINEYNHSLNTFSYLYCRINLSNYFPMMPKSCVLIQHIDYLGIMKFWHIIYYSINICFEMSINKSNKRIPQLYMISTKEDQDTIKITFKKYIQ